jgi:pimeloyl-ACP methyl ester carboxylesterase
MFQPTHLINRWIAPAAGALVCAGLGVHATAAQPPQARLALSPCHVDGVAQEVRCGTYEVFENRKARSGRKLPLKVVVLPARDPHPLPEPVFYFAGGPGETNTDFVKDFLDSPERGDHDMVFVDFRGTGEGHRLACRMPRSDDHLEGYLETPFSPAFAGACRDELARRFDLSQYSTAATADDVDEVRAALGYDQIDLEGGSFGTYASLIYMRAHGEHVRAAYLSSLVTLENRVPLYHAQAAQWGLDQLFAQCAADAGCAAAYPHLREDFAAVRARLHQGPVHTSVRHPVTGAKVAIDLTEPAFADAIRVMMYSGARGRDVPFLIEKAKAGDFDQLAEAAINSNRGFYAGVPVGLYYAVTCNEFVDRISPEEVEPATHASYAGAWRVKDQMASCREWPKTILPAGFFKPFRLSTPALLISGDTDSAAPPRWGEAVHAFMPASLHLVVPGGHVPNSACTDKIADDLFRTGTTKGLDTSCVATLRHTPFKLPPREG